MFQTLSLALQVNVNFAVSQWKVEKTYIPSFTSIFFVWNFHKLLEFESLVLTSLLILCLYTGISRDNP